MPALVNSLSGAAHLHAYVDHPEPGEALAGEARCKSLAGDLKGVSIVASLDGLHAS